MSPPSQARCICLSSEKRGTQCVEDCEKFNLYINMQVYTVSAGSSTRRKWRKQKHQRRQPTKKRCKETPPRLRQAGDDEWNTEEVEHELVDHEKVCEPSLSSSTSTSGMPKGNGGCCANPGETGPGHDVPAHSSQSQVIQEIAATDWIARARPARFSYDGGVPRRQISWHRTRNVNHPDGWSLKVAH